jgi:hypothetical protein
MSPLGLAIPPRCLADMGQSLPEWGAARRPFPPLATELRTSLVVRFVPEGDISSPPAQGLISCIRCGHLLNERLKSNDDFGCSVTVTRNEIEHLPDFFQIWRFSAQPV